MRNYSIWIKCKATNEQRSAIDFSPDLDATKDHAASLLAFMALSKGEVIPKDSIEYEQVGRCLKAVVKINALFTYEIAIGRIGCDEEVPSQHCGEIVDLTNCTDGQLRVPLSQLREKK